MIKKIMTKVPNCVRDSSGKPTARCSDSGTLRGLEANSPTLLGHAQINKKLKSDAYKILSLNFGIVG